MAIWNLNSGTFSPYLSNISPAPDATSVSSSASILFDILDPEDNIDPDTIKIYIKETLAYDGEADTFYTPYNGSSSARTDITDGYHFVIENTEDHTSIVSVYVNVKDYELYELYSRWAFIVDGSVNALYFCDGYYGLKGLDVKDIAGESQSVVRQMNMIDTMPPTPQNDIKFLHGERIDGISNLELSMDGDLGSRWGASSWADDLWGRYVGAIWNEFNWGSMKWGSIGDVGIVNIRNESNPLYYMDGYYVNQAQITDSGTLYVINQCYNQIYVFNGANERDFNYRAPDYIYNAADAYNAASVPPIVPGEILCLHVVSEVSSVYTQGTRIYVGTTTGMTRIETFDKHTDGYNDGFDAYGLSFSYGIVGSGYTYEVIGGDVPSVTSISSDEVTNTVLVATTDGYDNGGLTHITLEGNRKVVFLNESTGAIPSNDIRDIFGKGY